MSELMEDIDEEPTSFQPKAQNSAVNTEHAGSPSPRIQVSSPLRESSPPNETNVEQVSRTFNNNNDEDKDDEGKRTRRKRKARRKLFESGDGDADDVNNDPIISRIQQGASVLDRTATLEVNPQDESSLDPPIFNTTIASIGGTGQDHQQPVEENNNEEDKNNMMAKLLEKADETIVIEKKDPIIIRAEARKKNFMEYATFISEMRPVIEGVKRKIEVRANGFSQLHDIYLRRQKTKEAEECKLLADKLRQQSEKLSQEYSSKYRFFDPQEEGIFAEKKPYLLEKGQYILEHRLMREQDGLQKFFDENGQLIVQLDPTNKVFTKPGEFDFDLKENNVIALKKTIPTRSLRSTTASKHYKIDVDIREIIFEDHSLMTEEEIVTRKITDAFNRYEEVKEANKFQFYQQKIIVSILLSRYKFLNNCQTLQTELDRLRGRKDKNIKKSNPLDELSYLTKEIKEIEREMSVLRNEIRQSRSEMVCYTFPCLIYVSIRKMKLLKKFHL